MTLKIIKVDVIRGAHYSLRKSLYLESNLKLKKKALRKGRQSKTLKKDRFQPELNVCNVEHS